jgi:hypothetical protein
MFGLLVSTPRINTLSDWSLRRGAPTKKNWGVGVYSGGRNKYAIEFAGSTSADPPVNQLNVIKISLSHHHP